jgi:hypothetical protein
LLENQFILLETPPDGPQHLRVTIQVLTRHCISQLFEVAYDYVLVRLKLNRYIAQLLALELFLKASQLLQSAVQVVLDEA